MDTSLEKALIKKTKESENWFSVSTLEEWAFQILDGLEFLHSNQIAHRDLKV